MKKDLNKKVLAEMLAKKHELTKKAANEIVDEIFEEVKDTLAKGHVVDFFGFGKFEVKKRKARTGVNPATGAQIKIAATKVPAFKAAKALKEAVK